MATRPRKLRTVTSEQARRIWLRAQRLDTPEPFGSGPAATRAAVEHLGYVQIDTINVVERCHHHILYSRIPSYERAHLRHAQAVDKSVFEYWTHALSYIPTRDIRFFLGDMKRHRDNPEPSYASVGKKDMSKVMSLIRKGGALTIRDIDDDVLIEKDHPWASKKPSKRALQLAFYNGVLTVSERNGMVKSYELMDRHFGWESRPKPASETQRLDYLLDRALRSQGLVSLDSVCHLDAPSKHGIAARIASRIRKKELVPVVLAGAEKVPHWARPELLEREPDVVAAPVHILSPFDPLIIQRKRLQMIFGYEHRFEAYVPKEKRVFGYFALPVLVGDEIVAVVDLKTDRAAGKLLIQQWTWIRQETPELRRQIEEELARFERFQLAS